MKHSSFVIIAIYLFSACHKPVSRSNTINKIEIATSGCLRGCPVFGIIIDSSLALNYYGGYNARLKGYHSGVVTQGFWNTLNKRLKSINFKKLDTAENYPIDGEVAEVIFYWGKQKRHIYKSIDDDPDSLSHLLIAIVNSYKQVELHKSKDSIAFAVHYQFIQPPKPRTDQIKFPPPNKHSQK